MTKKEIVSELVALVLVYFVFVIVETLIRQWGNLPNHINWFDYKTYSSSTYAVLLVCSPVLYVYLPTKVNKWLYPFLMAAIWAICLVLISLLCLGALESKGIMLAAGFGFATALLRKYMPASFMKRAKK